MSTGRNLRPKRTTILSELPFRVAQDEEFCTRLNKTMRKIADVLTLHGLFEELNRYPLVGLPQRYDSGYGIRRPDLIEGLGRTAELLKSRLKLTNTDAFLTVAEAGEIAPLLKSARHQRNETQEAAADALRVSVDTVKSWEAGHARPSAKHLPQLAEYIRVPSR